jgi:oligo-1,6-glucosidase
MKMNEQRGNGEMTEAVWWKESVVYQIYPRSFLDSNGDGIGDLPGVVSKLDYLQELGVNVLWLSPVYRSPNADNGYDISDYQSIHPELGTMADWDNLLSEVHRRDMKLIMDLVVNHTSDEHPWFVEAKANPLSPKRNYYIWRNKPNNWASCFGGSAWEYDPDSGEYYLHLFFRKQPDLNWANPELRREIYAMMRWWLDKGIDGFRMDVINFIAKDNRFPEGREEGAGPYYWGGEHFVNGPRVHEYLQEMYREVLSGYPIVTVGETPCITPEEAILYAGGSRRELNMVFSFEHMELDCASGDKWAIKPWQLSRVKKVLSKWQTGLYGRGWNSLYLGNHDQPRSVSRFGNDGRYRQESAKLLATLLFTLQGTPFIYQGEEIGMTNVAFSAIEDYRDIETINFYRTQKEKQRPVADIMKAIHAKSRDNARTPFQWDGSVQGGFSSNSPWLRINPNYSTVNAEEDRADPAAIFHYYRKLIALRKRYPVLIYGDYRLLLPEDEQVYAFVRTLGQEKVLVILNFFAGENRFSVPEGIQTEELLAGNYSVDGKVKMEMLLKPYEARVYRC